MEMIDEKRKCLYNMLMPAYKYMHVKVAYLMVLNCWRLISY